MERTRTTVRLTALAGVVMLVAACATGGGATTAPSAAPSAAASAAASEAAPSTAAMYTIGYSNGGGVGNGFREEQVCTAKAEALASGKVSTLTTIHRNTDAAGQLQDIRDLITKGVKAIVFNPNDPDALNPALDEAQAAGIKTVSVDAYVTNPDTYQLFNNQVKYAELGAKWLFDKLGGKGTVWYQRGFAGAGADTDRDTGFQNVLKDYPNITVLPNKQGVATQWDPAITTQVTNDFIASGDYDKATGIWTSGMDVETIDAIKAAGKKFIPLVGTDRGGSVTKALDATNYPGLDFSELARDVRREVLVPLLGHDHVVLDAHADASVFLGHREIVGLERLLADAVEASAARRLVSHLREALFGRGHGLEHVDVHRERAAVELVRARVPPPAPRSLLRCDELLPCRVDGGVADHLLAHLGRELTCRRVRLRDLRRGGTRRHRRGRDRNREEHRARGHDRAHHRIVTVSVSVTWSTSVSRALATTRQSPAMGMLKPGDR